MPVLYDLNKPQGLATCTEEAARRSLIGLSGLVQFAEEDRSNEQNKLQRLWMREAERQGDCTAEEYRGYCKLHFGIVILKESDSFAQRYDAVFKPLPYKTKLSLMQEPFDFPVTRLMSKKQKVRYLNDVYTHFTGLGMRLTEPDLKNIEQYPEAR
tara:strand:- start:106 stop:570 length:465 start_codon:yes stop_codon:yes gene_type:complete